MSDALNWVTAVGTLLAAAVPAILWSFERRDRRAAEAALRAREEADRAAAVQRQARQVFVWKLWGDSSDDRDGVNLLNTSDLPIFDVGLYGYGRKKRRQVLEEDGYAHAVMPGAALAAAASSPIADDVWVAFRDASGQSWARNQLGALVRDPDSEAMHEAPPA
ncbi:hypothetical protein Q9R32_09225 [Actinotalea sp. AC32]|nr:hypothetical protein [Actinotalea sp. AC32]